LLVAEPIENFKIIVAEAHLAIYVRESIANFYPSAAEFKLDLRMQHPIYSKPAP